MRCSLSETILATVFSTVFGRLKPAGTALEQRLQPEYWHAKFVVTIQLTVFFLLAALKNAHLQQ